MPTIAKHGRRGYAQGCRCDQCKCAEREYQRELRRRKAAGDGKFASPELTLLRGASGKPVTSGNTADQSANSPECDVEAAVLAEIETLGALARPGLVATARALARVMNDPRATSTKPAAAARLEGILETLRKSGGGKKTKLAAVRSMTSGNTKTG